MLVRGTDVQFRVARALVTSQLLLLLLASCSQKTAILKEKGSVIVQIQFARSGGFGGAATNVSGTVEFTDRGAHVRSEVSGYEREVPEAEAQPLRSAVDPATLAQVQAALSAPSPLRDAYQYDLTLVAQDGSSHTLRFTGDGPPEALRQTSPAATSLASWVRDETQKIWKHRVSSRK